MSEVKRSFNVQRTSGCCARGGFVSRRRRRMVSDTCAHFQLNIIRRGRRFSFFCLLSSRGWVGVVCIFMSRVFSLGFKKFWVLARNLYRFSAWGPKFAYGREAIPIISQLFLDYKMCFLATYKSYFVPIVQEMTAMGSVWLCTYGQTLGAHAKNL